MALDLKRLVAAVQDTDHVILPRYLPWLLHNGDRPLPEWVADKVHEQLKAVPRDRSASFAGSASGKCPRQQILSYFGVRGDGTIDPQLQEIFNDGKWRHLRLQANFLAAGVIDDIEYPLYWRRMHDRGTMDGIGTVPMDHPKPHWRGKSFGLEIKGANSWVYKTFKDDGPDKYKRQYHRYMLSGGFDLFVVIAEDKNTQEKFEWVVEPDPLIMAEVEEELLMLNSYRERRKLPVRKRDCKMARGPEFHDCPFGGKNGICLTSDTLDEALAGRSAA